MFEAMFDQLNEKAAKVAELEARFAAIQVRGVSALATPAGDTESITKDATALKDDADKARARDVASAVRRFIVAFSQFSIQRNVVALKGVVKASLKEAQSFKLAAQIIKKALKDLAVPRLNDVLAGLYRDLGALHGVLQRAAEADMLDNDLKKRQTDLEAALKKIADALKKIEDDAKKKQEEAAKKAKA
jgi:hypothetical protein